MRIGVGADALMNWKSVIIQMAHPDGGVSSAPAPVRYLLDLPHDALSTILWHSSLESHELCALLRTCHTLADLICDESCWQRVFRQARRMPVLGGAPKSWKAEVARREVWSRSWRDYLDAEEWTVPCRLPVDQVSIPLLTPSRKLRKLELLSLSTAAPAALPPPGALVVNPAPSQPGCFRSIASAVECAPPHSRVLVAPGQYMERILLASPIDVSADGRPSSLARTARASLTRSSL